MRSAIAAVRAQWSTVQAQWSNGTRAKNDSVHATGNPHKRALTALMRKLIQLANTLIKDDRLWHPKPA